MPDKACVPRTKGAHRARRWRLTALGPVLVALIAGSTIASPVASAGNPPFGLYACYLDHDVNYYTLSFRFKPNGRYKKVDGGKGTYRLRNHGKNIRWKTGPFKNFYGTHTHYYAGPLINIFGKSGGEKFRLVCEHRS